VAVAVREHDRARPVGGPVGTARSDVPAQSRRYGLGFWLGRHTGTVFLEGFDAGVSFRSVHDPASAVTRTVISNSSYGAWPITRRLDDLLAG
jgi:hypothetical protein